MNPEYFEIKIVTSLLNQITDYGVKARLYESISQGKKIYELYLDGKPVDQLRSYREAAMFLNGIKTGILVMRERIINNFIGDGNV